MLWFQSVFWDFELVYSTECLLKQYLLDCDFTCQVKKDTYWWDHYYTYIIITLYQHFSKIGSHWTHKICIILTPPEGPTPSLPPRSSSPVIRVPAVTMCRFSICDFSALFFEPGSLSVAQTASACGYPLASASSAGVTNAHHSARREIDFQFKKTK